jgi:hypothetical protein
MSKPEQSPGSGTAARGTDHTVGEGHEPIIVDQTLEVKESPKDTIETLNRKGPPSIWLNPRWLKDICKPTSCHTNKIPGLGIG